MGRNTPLTDICRVHAIVANYPLVRGVQIPVAWEKEWTNNNTTFQQIKKLFDVGLVTYRLITGHKSNKKILLVMMPERYLTPEQFDDHKRILYNFVQQAANWFMRNSGCQLGLPDISDPEFAFPEDPSFVQIAKEGRIKGESCWVDSSEGRPEWETNDPRLALIKINNPSITAELCDRVLNLEDTIGKIQSTMDGISSQITNLSSTLDALFSQPGTSPSIRDTQWG